MTNNIPLFKNLTEEEQEIARVLMGGTVVNIYYDPVFTECCWIVLDNGKEIPIERRDLQAQKERNENEQE